jgi:nitrite reductase (NO-forming)
MSEGEGLEGVFPPLAKTGRLTDKGKLVKIVVNGMSGPITVNGKQYDLEMIPVNLSDEEVRDVLNYMRNSWGNKEPAISLAEVKKFRDKK